MERLKIFFLAVNKFNIVLIIPIFFFCYALTTLIHAKQKKRVFESHNSNNSFIYKLSKGKISFSNMHHNSAYLQRIDTFLHKQGNPIGLNAANYYPVKALLFVFFFILGVKNYGSLFAAIILGLIGFFSINIFIFINGIIRNNSIIRDLLTVVDCLYLQMSAHVTLKDALRGLNAVCKNSDLKKALIRLSAKYELTEYNIEEAVNDFTNNFDILEIEMFSAALTQQVTSGSSTEVLNSLSEILKDSYINKLNLNTKVKILYITLGVAAILLNIIALTFFPIFMDIGENMRKIFI